MTPFLQDHPSKLELIRMNSSTYHISTSYIFNFGLLRLPSCCMHDPFFIFFFTHCLYGVYIIWLISYYFSSMYLRTQWPTLEHSIHALHSVTNLLVLTVLQNTLNIKLIKHEPLISFNSMAAIFRRSLPSSGQVRESCQFQFHRLSWSQ